jgi:hypothetical protein
LKILLIIIYSTTISGCGTIPTPQLSKEDRKKDIEFLAEWARDYSPLVGLAEKHKGYPSYEALLPKYINYTEQAQSNEELYQVVRGYYDLICSAGHHGLIGEKTLKLGKLGILLGVIDLDISPFTANQACYWSRLAKGNLTVRAYPPFQILYEDDKYITTDDWKVDAFTVPKGSQIIKVNGMNCTAYLNYIRENTSLKYDAFSTDWTKKYLLIIYEGDDFKGWQVDFLLPDNSIYNAFVPMIRVYSRSATMIRGHSTSVPKLKVFPAPKEKIIHVIKPKENCTCIELTDEIAYIRIKSMMPGGLWNLIFNSNYKKDGKIIKSFLENANSKYRKLIIDIRGNSGGMPYYVYENLIRPFLDEPVTYDQMAGMRRKYRDNLKPSVLKTLRKWCSSKKEHVVNIEEIDAPEYFDSKEWVFYRVTRRIEPNNRYNFDGSLYILMDSRTFSAADIYADAAKRIGLAKLVGRNTSGGCAAYLGSPIIRLPASGMIFRVETEIVINPDGSINELFGTKPDVKLPPTKLPKSITREELLKDEWIKYIIYEM